MATDVYVALGGDLGDRLATFAEALRRIGRVPDTRLLAVSPVYETEAWPDPSEPPYANAVALVRTTLSAPELLAALQRIETGLGRVRETRWGARTIDLDILLFGDEAWDLPELTVPHPRLLEREFAVRPLLDLAPDVRLPDGTRVRDAARPTVGRVTSVLYSKAHLSEDRLDPRRAGTAGKEHEMSASVSEPERKPVTVATLRDMKAAGEPIVMITAYDAPGARLVDAAGADVILVGDSLGMVVLGHGSTLPVTMDDMLRHTAAVVRGADRPLVVGDMPFMSYQLSADDAVRNAGRFLAEAGAGAVKLEGGAPVAPVVARMVDAGIPVMGHLGLTPQSVNAFGGYRVQARDAAAAERLVADALSLEAAGAFAVVLELVPAEVAALVTEELSIPTIGIGAGAGCDGQVQVFHDLLGLGDFVPRHAKRYAHLGDAVVKAVAAYAADVRQGAFPGDAQTTHADPELVAELERTLPFTDGEAE